MILRSKFFILKPGRHDTVNIHFINMDGTTGDYVGMYYMMTDNVTHINCLKATELKDFIQIVYMLKNYIKTEIKYSNKVNTTGLSVKT